MGVGKIESLIRGLPLESAFGRSMHPDSVGVGWGMSEELLASVCELLDVNNRQFATAHSKKGTKLPPALRITRPYTKPKRNATAREIRRLMGGVEVVRVEGGEE